MASPFEHCKTKILFYFRRSLKCKSLEYLLVIQTLRVVYTIYFIYVYVYVYKIYIRNILLVLS